MAPDLFSAAPTPSAREPYASVIQVDTNRCLVCGERETRDAPFIAVLTPTRGKHHWLHEACHEAHVDRCAAQRRAETDIAA